MKDVSYSLRCIGSGSAENCTSGAMLLGSRKDLASLTSHQDNDR